jgi:hypothetical protein
MIQYLNMALCPSVGVAFVAWSAATIAACLPAVNPDLITVYHTLASVPSVSACPSYFMVTGHNAPQLKKLTLRRLIMKTILSALVALSALAGVVAPAAASDFSIKQLDQDNRGGHNYGGSVIEQLDKEGRGGHNT